MATQDVQQKKKKKKNPLEKQQPAWLFPPDSENPVLNPKLISEEQRRKMKEEWDEAIKSLKYKSVTAPMKPPPPAKLLALVGAFLSSYGFNSTSRIYTLQVKSREKLDEWKTEVGVKLPKGFPDLVKIYKDWYRTYEEDLQPDVTSSDEDESEKSKVAKKSRKISKSIKIAPKTEETSSSGSSDSDSDRDRKKELVDTDMSDAKPVQKSVKKPSESASSTSSSSSSDSDADDEKEVAEANPLLMHSILNKASSQSKRKSSPSTSSSLESVSYSDTSLSEDKKPPKNTEPKLKSNAGQQKPKKQKTKKVENGDEPEVKKPRIISKETLIRSPLSSSSSSSSSSSEEESSTRPKHRSSTPSSQSSSSSSDSTSPPSEPTPNLRNSANPPPPILPASSKLSTSSSGTLQPPSPNIALPVLKRKASASPPLAQAATKKPRNAPFQRVPSDTKVDPKLASNAYVSHEYGDRAHQDLSVTRGKNFTKEKNKKKRGSYRGGAIDVSGGKGIKFV